MLSSEIFLISLCICVGSLIFGNQLKKDLFETPEDEADKVNKDASESEWTLYRLSNWAAIISGLIAIVKGLAMIFLIVLGDIFELYIPF